MLYTIGVLARITNVIIIIGSGDSSSVPTRLSQEFFICLHQQTYVGVCTSYQVVNRTWMWQEEYIFFILGHDSVKTNHSL